jgi:hypothetical protein
MSWHADVESLDRYLEDRLSNSHAASVEAHLLACPTCRDVLARRSEAEPGGLERHDDTWDRIADAVDRPGLTVLERLLGCVGVRYGTVRLAVGAPALRRAWWLAGVALLTFAVVTAHLGSGTIGTVTFVVTAPVVPLIGVALSYGAHGDPAGEVSTVAPYSAFRLVVLRTLVVLLSSLPIAALLALALPTHPAAGLLWFVPALALCSLTLAASTFVDPLLVAGLLATGWLTSAGLTVHGPKWMPAGQLLDQFVAFRPIGQLLLAVLALAGVLLTVIRRSAFDTWSAS